MWYKNKYQLFSSVLLGLFLLCSYLTPSMFDDLYYETFTQGDAGFWTNLFSLLKAYYLTWGGRVLAHFFAGIILSFQSHLVYMYANAVVISLVVLWLGLITLYLLNHDEKNNERYKAKDVYLFIAILILFFGKKSMQTMFWITGSMNYLWMAAFQLAFLYFNREWLFGSKNLKVKWYKLPLFCLLALLTGLTNENAGLGLLTLIAATFYFRKREQQKKIFRPQELIVSGFLLLGTAILLLAPGNAARKAVVEANGATPLFQKLNWFLESYLVFFGRLDGVILLLLILFTYIAFKAKKSTPPIIQNPAFIKLWILFGASSFAFLGHNGNFYGRSSFNLSLFFILIASFLIFTFLKQSSLATKKYETLFTRMKVVLAIAILIKMSFTLQNIYQFHTYYKQRDHNIREQIKSGKKDIETYNFRHSQIYDLEDLNPDPKNPVNLIFADHYKVNSITAKEEKIIPWIKRNR